MRRAQSLSVEQQEAAMEMLAAGKSQGQVAMRLGVSKNVIAGVWARRDVRQYHDPKTLFERCDALNAKLDAVLKATGNVPKYTGPPP